MVVTIGLWYFVVIGWGAEGGQVRSCSSTNWHLEINSLLQSRSNEVRTLD